MSAPDSKASTERPLMDVLRLALEALTHSRASMEHRPEANSRHEEAKAAVRAALDGCEAKGDEFAAEVFEEIGWTLDGHQVFRLIHKPTGAAVEWRGEVIGERVRRRLMGALRSRAQAAAEEFPL